MICYGIRYYAIALLLYNRNVLYYIHHTHTHTHTHTPHHTHTHTHYTTHTHTHTNTQTHKHTNTHTHTPTLGKGEKEGGEMKRETSTFTSLYSR